MELKDEERELKLREEFKEVKMAEFAEILEDLTIVANAEVEGRERSAAIISLS